jgi:hypothetical protein
MDRRLQRDQAAGEQAQQQAFRPADRGCALLASDRAAGLLPHHRSAGRCQDDDGDRRRSVCGACVNGDVRILAVFDAKYHYEFWRPVTAIRSGDLLRNPAIERDPVWQPIDSTPMHPEYPCAHCIVAASLAAVVGEVLGPDIPPISAKSPAAPGVTHHWTDMQSFVTEVSEARIWAGFHYRFSTQVGARMGYRIGAYVATTSLRPLPLATR